MASQALVELERISKDAEKALKADPLIAATMSEWVRDDVTDKLWFATITRYADTHGLKATYLRIRLVLERANLLDKLSLDRVFVIPHSEWETMKRRMMREPNLFQTLGIIR